MNEYPQKQLGVVQFTPVSSFVARPVGRFPKVCVKLVGFAQFLTEFRYQNGSNFIFRPAPTVVFLKDRFVKANVVILVRQVSRVSSLSRYA